MEEMMKFSLLDVLSRKQVLLSQSHRFRALVLLGRFLDMGAWAVDLVIFLTELFCTPLMTQCMNHSELFTG